MINLSFNGFFENPVGELVKSIFNYLSYLKYDLIGMKWPNGTELMAALGVVLSVTAALGLYIFGVDYLSVKFYQFMVD